MALWFRMYHELLDDPKVQRLPAEVFKAWVNILCLAARNDGALPTVADIAFALRFSEEKTTRILGELSNAGLLDDEESGVVPHNWGQRQFKSDVSTDRVRRYRKRDRNVDETFQETAPDTESDTDSESETESHKPNGLFDTGAGDAAAPAKSIAQDVTAAVDAYNVTAERLGLRTVATLTAQRRSKLKARLRASGIEGWRAALVKLESIPGLLGGHGGSDHENWKADFDFLVTESKFVRLMEGGYDGWGASADGAGNGRAPPAADHRTEMLGWFKRQKSKGETPKWDPHWGDPPTEDELRRAAG